MSSPAEDLVKKAELDRNLTDLATKKANIALSRIREVSGEPLISVASRRPEILHSAIRSAKGLLQAGHDGNEAIQGAVFRGLIEDQHGVAQVVRGPGNSEETCLDTSARFPEKSWVDSEGRRHFVFADGSEGIKPADPL